MERNDRGQLLSIGEMAEANRVAIATLIDEDMAAWQRSSTTTATMPSSAECSASSTPKTAATEPSCACRRKHKARRAP